MQKSGSSNSPGPSRRTKKSPGATAKSGSARNAAPSKSQSGATAPRGRKKDPFAKPENPLGFRFLSEERPIRATRFDAILPSLAAKYGFGRRLGAEKMRRAWSSALAAVLSSEAADYDDCRYFDDGGLYDDGSPFAESAATTLETFERNARPTTFRGGTLTVQVSSALLSQELQYRLPQLLAKVREAVPEENVERVKLVLR